MKGTPMTQADALAAARTILGPATALEMQPKGARIGMHMEFVDAQDVSRGTPADPLYDRYCCRTCSGTTLEANGDVTMRQVWHPAGPWLTAYRIGVLVDGQLHVKAADFTWEACLAQLQEAR